MPPFLTQIDEQIKGLSPNLTYGRSELIEKSLQRNETKNSLTVKNPSGPLQFSSQFFQLEFFQFKQIVYPGLLFRTGQLSFQMLHIFSSYYMHNKCHMVG